MHLMGSCSRLHQLSRGSIWPGQSAGDYQEKSCALKGVATHKLFFYLSEIKRVKYLTCRDISPKIEMNSSLMDNLTLCLGCRDDTEMSVYQFHRLLAY